MKKDINYSFLTSSALLVVFGILFLATLSAPQSLRFFGSANYYFFHQLAAIAIGLILAVVAFKIPLKYIKKASLVLLVINLLLLLVVFLPKIGLKFWGASRWINIGFGTVQPSEFLKITAILYLAAWMSSKFSKDSKKVPMTSAKKNYHNFVNVFIPFLVLLAVVSIFLVLQKDASTLGIITLSLLAVYFISGTPFWHIILAILIEFSGALLLIKLEPYRLQRLLTFLNPEVDPLGRGFQIKQSILAIGSGGFFGKGWGMSTQKFGFLPQAMTDSIFAIMGEEIGIFGCSIFLGLLLFFIWQGIKIAKQASDQFSKMVAVGIITWITAQSFMSVTSALGMWPLSGIPLPFFSYGGSHIIAELIGIGILLNISKNG